jgi:hypothetical protein
MNGNWVDELLRLDQELETISILHKHMQAERGHEVDRQAWLVAIIEKGRESDEGGVANLFWGGTPARLKQSGAGSRLTVSSRATRRQRRLPRCWKDVGGTERRGQSGSAWRVHGAAG